MSWFRKKEKRAVDGDVNEVINCNLYLDDKNVPRKHKHGMEYNLLGRLKAFEQLIKPEPQSDIDHILWLMDKFPVEDFEEKGNLLQFSFEPLGVYFKSVLILPHPFSGVTQSKKPLMGDYQKISDKIRLGKIDAKNRERQAVLNEMADERIAAVKEAPTAEIDAILQMGTEAADRLKASISIFKENKSVKKAYKRKARVKGKAKKTAG